MFAWLKKLFGRKKPAPEYPPYTYKITAYDKQGNEIHNLSGRAVSVTPNMQRVPVSWPEERQRIRKAMTVAIQQGALAKGRADITAAETPRARSHVIFRKDRDHLKLVSTNNVQQFPRDKKHDRVIVPTPGGYSAATVDGGEVLELRKPGYYTPFGLDYEDPNLQQEETTGHGGSFSGAGASGDWDNSTPTPTAPVSTPVEEPDQCTRSNYTSYTSSDDSSSSSSCSSDSSSSSSSDSSSPSDSSW